MRKCSSVSGRVTSAAGFPATHCPCGGGLCVISQAKLTGRLFYSCPAINGMKCEYFKWCDKLKEDEILHDRPMPYPICACKAGVCRLETDTDGRKYFACNIVKGEGACNFHLWEDDYFSSVLANSDSQFMTISNDSVAEDILFINNALENGEIELDFFELTHENALTDTDIDVSNEISTGDDETSSNPSPTSTNQTEGFLSRWYTDNRTENYLSDAFTISAEGVISADLDDEEWWRSVARACPY